MSPPVPPTLRPGRGADARRLAEILRVDHAGELGAVAIYQGQRAVFAALDKPPALAAQLEEMAAHEAVHLAAFDKLLTEKGVRPTILTPLWRLAGFALGAGTALMGEKAAHACTEAVESVIEQHYAEQIEELRPREPELADALSGYRDDELGPSRPGHSGRCPRSARLRPAVGGDRRGLPCGDPARRKNLSLIRLLRFDGGDDSRAGFKSLAAALAMAWQIKDAGLRGRWGLTLRKRVAP